MNETIVDELDEYKIKIKENIESYISNGLLSEAVKLINQYEDIIQNDIDINSMKAIISILNGEFIEALKILNAGLIIEPSNIDLLYNKAYVLEQIGLYKSSYIVYKNIITKSKNEEILEESKKKISKLLNIGDYIKLDGRISLLTISKEISKEALIYISDWLNNFGFTIIQNFRQAENGMSGLDLKYFLILYDLNPVDLEERLSIEYPLIDNKRYFLIKNLIDELSRLFKNNNFKEIINLTLNEEEAIDLIDKLMNRDKVEIFKKIVEIEEKYDTKYPVIKLFDGFRHRAKTELIKYKDGFAVKKTWKPGNERFYEREKFACGELSKKISYIPNLLDYGINYIIIPYYENIFYNDERTKKIILTNNISDISKFLKDLYDNNFFNPDIHPGQFIYSKEYGLKAIDFEYLQEYDDKPTSFLKSYDIKGYPKNFKGDKPNYTGGGLHNWYNNLWKEYTGYTLDEIAEFAIEKKYSYDDAEINKVLGILNYAKTSGQTYNGYFYESAYHSFRIKDYYFRGQREPNLRLKNVPYNFSNKTILDIGCNAGGMLHALADKIDVGVGIDYDYRLVNAANAIKFINKKENLNFFRFDLENEDLDLIKNFILTKGEKIDMCFLLSVCMWIKNWRDVIKFTSEISDNLLFETNGTYEEQVMQIEELKIYYSKIILIDEESYDDPGQRNRKLLLCSNK